MRYSKICVTAVAALLVFTVAAVPCRADETAQRADRITAEGLALLHSAATKDVDMVLLALGNAYKGTSYAGNEGAESFRTRLAQQGESIKASVAALLKETAAGADPKSPGAMIVLLSKAQMLSVVMYRWIRSTQEMTNLALASSGRTDAETGEYFTSLMQTHEAFQDVAGEVIQQLAMNTEAK